MVLVTGIRYLYLSTLFISVMIVSYDTVGEMNISFLKLFFENGFYHFLQSSQTMGVLILHMAI